MDNTGAHKLVENTTTKWSKSERVDDNMNQFVRSSNIGVIILDEKKLFFIILKLFKPCVYDEIYY